MTKQKKLIALSVLLSSVMFTGCEEQQEKPANEEHTKQQVAPEKKVEEKNSVKPESVANTPVTTEKKAEEKSTSETNKVVAEFTDGHKIIMGDLLSHMNGLPQEVKNQPFSKLYYAILNHLVDTHLLLDAAKKSDLEKDSEVIKKMEEVQKNLIQKAFIEDKIKGIMKEEDLKARYDELVAKMPKDEMEVKIRHILVKSKEEAEKLIKELQGKSSTAFEDAAKSQSLDNQTRARGGDLGYIRKGDLPKAFGESIFKATKNTVLKEAIDLGGQGFSVIYIDDKRPAQPPKFDAIRKELEKTMAPEYAMKVVTQLQKESGVKKYGLDGKLLPETKPEDANKEKKAPAVDISKLDDKMIVAEFADGHKVTLGDVREHVKTLPPQFQAMPFHEIFEALVGRLVDTYLLSIYSIKGGFDKNPEVLKTIAQGKEAVLQKTYLDKEVGKLITDQMMKEKYNELLKLLPKGDMEARIRHILVKTEDEAKAIIKELKSGVKFEDSVTKHSIDEKTKADKGEIGYVRRGDLPKEFGDAIFSAAKATLVPNPVKLGELGWSVIRVEDKRPVEPPKFEEVKGELHKIVSAEQSMIVIKKLRANKVTLFDMDGKPIKETEEKPAA